MKSIYYLPYHFKALNLRSQKWIGTFTIANITNVSNEDILKLIFSYTLFNKL